MTLENVLTFCLLKPDPGEINMVGAKDELTNVRKCPLFQRVASAVSLGPFCVHIWVISDGNLSLHGGGNVTDGAGQSCLTGAWCHGFVWQGMHGCMALSCH